MKDKRSRFLKFCIIYLFVLSVGCGTWHPLETRTSPQTLRIGVDQNPPYSDLTKKRFEGLHLDVPADGGLFDHINQQSFKTLLGQIAVRWILIQSNP